MLPLEKASGSILKIEQKYKEVYMSRREKVTKVIDGDTFKTASRKRSIRLANVDAPEKGKPGSVKATAALRKMIGGKNVRIKTVCRDKYGRAIANVYDGRTSVNKRMAKKVKKHD